MTAKVNEAMPEGGSFPDELKPGTSLLHGQYTIERFLNRGGFGITYLAKDSLEQLVVVKECYPGMVEREDGTVVRVSSPDHQNEFDSIVELFVQEARNLATLKHPNIVGVHQVFEDNNTAYMALDYVPGRDLMDVLDNPHDNLTPNDVQLMTRKILGAVGFIHSKGILHRDISPDNIVLTKENYPVLIDFGSARVDAVKARGKLNGMRAVKDGYSPQEFYVSGSPQTPASDLYALAATLYHLIVGATPADSHLRHAAVVAQKPDPFHGFPPSVEGYDEDYLTAITQALNVLPEDRIQTADEWLKMIQPWPQSVAVLPAAATDASNAKAAPKPAAAAPDIADSEDQAVRHPVFKTMELEKQEQGDPDLDALRAHLQAKPQKKGKMVAFISVSAAALLAAGYAASVVWFADDAIRSTETTQVAAVAEAAPTTPVETAPAVNETVQAATPATPTTNETVAVATESVEVATAAPLTPSTDPETTSGPDVVLPAASQAGSSTANTQSDVAVGQNGATPPIALNATNTPDVETAVPVLTEGAPVSVAQPATSTPELPNVVVENSAQTVAVATQDDLVPAAGSTEPLSEPAAGTPLSVDPTVLESAALPVPTPETAETVGVIDASVVMAGWSVVLPFEKDGAKPTTISGLSKESASWMRPGQKIVSVNGVQISSIDDINSIVKSSAAITGGNGVDVQFLYQQPGASDIEIGVATMPVARDVALLNGTIFRSQVADDNTWTTSVIASPATSDTAVKTGDQIVAYIPTGEKLADANAMARIMERELLAGITNFEFAVNRDGELWFASFKYSAGIEN